MRRGEVASALAAEHPGLWLAWTEVEATPGPTPRELAARLRGHADRIGGARRWRCAAVTSRTPTACSSATSGSIRTSSARRSRRSPSATAGGGLHPRNLVDDACTVACSRSASASSRSTPIALSAPLCLREHEGARDADDDGPVSVGCSATRACAAVTRRRRIALVAVAVPNVPDLFVEEAPTAEILAASASRAGPCANPRRCLPSRSCNVRPTGRDNRAPRLRRHMRCVLLACALFFLFATPAQAETLHYKFGLIHIARVGTTSSRSQRAAPPVTCGSPGSGRIWSTPVTRHAAR